ncbi:MAG: 4a-hydroxytetrahydrobiopterin dehydratase [Verrucomicrobiota bacterium]
MAKSADKKCGSCSGETPLLKKTAIKKLSKKLGASWKVTKNHHLEREYKFKNFKEALAFTNKVGKLAERVQHHPDIYLAWGKVKLTLWTHEGDGLTEYDFDFAAKVNRIK